MDERKGAGQDPGEQVQDGINELDRRRDRRIQRNEKALEFIVMRGLSDQFEQWLETQEGTP